MTTVVRTTRNTESLAQDESVDFVSGIQNADIRTAGALDNWRLRITNYADANSVLTRCSIRTPAIPPQH
jgi:hypothetical protein